ncbi:hypothetical protein LJR251_002775 [Rhizobium rhizogenes]
MAAGFGGEHKVKIFREAGVIGGGVFYLVFSYVSRQWWYSGEGFYPFRVQ